MEVYNVQQIQKVFHRVTRHKQIHEAVLLVENVSGDFTYSEGYGGREIDSPMIMASITKLFTTTCVIQLEEQGLLSFEDTLDKYFAPAVLKGLHIYKGVEYAGRLAIKDLLYQCSGLPDVFEETSHSIKKQAIEHDSYIGFDDMLVAVKGLKPHFAPRDKNCAYYADINFDLLGEIIEKVTGLPLHEVYRQCIIAPLGLSKTYLPVNEEELIPKIYYKEKYMYRPLTIRSSRASGGCVSTVREMMVFIKSFFSGVLFEMDVTSYTSQYRKIQYTMGPIQYGFGHMRVQLGGCQMAFQGQGALYGHTGSTGSFAFYYPTGKVFFVGDVNQMANPAIPIRTVIQLAIACKHK